MSATAVTPAVVMMTKSEAQRCVDRIKASAEEIAALLLDLRDREGWRALGYQTWQECISQEFHMSRSYAHRLINADLVKRALTLPIGNTERLPESHARELAPLLDEPETLRQVHAEVSAAKGEQATAADYRTAVERVRPKPPSARRSVTSRAEAGDFADDAPDYTAASQDAPGEGGGAETWCQDCGGRYRGERCPCATTLPSDATEKPEPPSESESAPEQPSTPEPRLTRDPESEPARAVMGAEPETIADFQELIFRKLSPGQVTGLVARCLKEKMDERGVQATAAFAASLLGTTAETAPTAPAEAAESSTGDDRPIARRYAEGMTAAVLLTKLDPAEVVGSLTPAQRAGAKAQHAVVRKWLDDLDFAIFKADQRAQPAASGAR